MALDSLAGVLAGRVELTPESSLVVGGATVMSVALMVVVSRRAGARLKELRGGTRVPREGEDDERVREGEEDERAARAAEADDVPFAMDQPARYAKIGNPDVPLAIQEDIPRLDIAVDLSITMNIT